MQQKQEGRCLLLTSEQEQWLHIQKMVATTQPTQPFKPPENKSRKKVFKIVTSSKFDAIVMGVIITNVLFMALAHANMSQVWKSTMFIAGASFTAFFTVEAAVKIFALGIQDYFKVGQQHPLIAPGGTFAPIDLILEHDVVVYKL